MLLDKCNEACGYAAAVTAAVCLGSFGVPVKSEVVSRLDVDPLVMQTYKTCMCFLTCWLVVLMGEPLRFTRWGIVSGFFWVPGGWAGIYGIRTAGLAVAVGTWSAMIVLTSFMWGIFVFEERVKSKLGACCACGTLILGLIGMSMYSTPPAKKGLKKEGEVEEKRRRKKRQSLSTLVEDEEDNEGMRRRKEKTTPLQDVPKPGGKGPSKEPEGTVFKMSKRGVGKKPQIEKKVKVKVKVEAKTTPSGKAAAPASLPLTSLELESLLDRDAMQQLTTPDAKNRRVSRISFFDSQLSLTKRQCGILASLFNGLWGGTNMIPLHFAAHDGYGGPSYVISFGCGATLVTLGLWMLRFLYELYRLDGAVSKAYHALPSFYLRQMWLQGAMSGLLYSAGNFMCIIAVIFLGQGVGYSFTQASMLISGLWGIFRFHEIEGRERILKWLSSASISVMGILWLSYEHAS